MAAKVPDLANGANLQIQVVGLTLRAAVSDNNGHRVRVGVVVAPPLHAHGPLGA